MSASPGRVRPSRFLVVFLLVSLLVAGFVSFYASSNPDGLEHVAEQTGFLDTAEEHAAGDGPFADYQVTGVEDERLGGGLAGVLGSLVVLALAGGLFWLLRRRGSPDGAPDAGPHDVSGATSDLSSNQA